MQSAIDLAEKLLQQYGHLSVWIAGFSVLMLVVSVLAMPYFIAAIPDDYFARDPRSAHIRDYLGIGAIITLAVKNTVGFGLIFAGIVMLLLPGQGLLTLFAGIILAEFPGKHRLVHRFAAIPSVLKTLNYFRRKQNKPEFELPKHPL